MKTRDLATSAFRFVLIIGVANLFADMTYEGARGITGPFLGSLGASATIVGFVAGFGELIGYSLRSVSGYLADKSSKYWIITFVGYLINMLAVPALALAGNWPLAAALIVAERAGRAVRRPAVEAMLSYAGKSIGRGWVFGLNEALDQGGATVGPLITALVLYLHGSYQNAFAVLLISALLCFGTLVIARVHYPHPGELEEKPARSLQTKRFSKRYWLYLAAGALIAAGFADFALIAFHFQKTAIVAKSMIPVLYAAAMATGALSSLVFGRMLDKLGLSVLLMAVLLSALFAPFVFLGGLTLALIGMSSGGSAWQHRIHCSKPSWPTLSREKSEARHSACLTLVLALPGSLVVPPWGYCMTNQYSLWCSFLSYFNWPLCQFCFLPDV